MKHFMTSVTVSLIAGSLAFGGAAFAQQGSGGPEHNGGSDQHDNGGPGQRDDGPKKSPAKWKKGGKIERGDWDRGQKVDYRKHKLRKPPRGYEWREVDGNYVLAAVASGLISSIILSH